MNLSGVRLEATRRRFVAAACAVCASSVVPLGLRSQEAPRSPTAGGQSPERLRWSPPPQESATEVDVGASAYSSPRFAPDEDVVVRLPSVEMRLGADIQINGGRHVRVVGGHMRGRLMWKNGAGSLFVEGLIIDLTATPNRDAIVVSGGEGRAPDVYLQNVLVTGVQGTFAGTHADVFQPYGPIGNLRVHAFTADTNYQGFFIRPEYAVTSATFSRVNMKFNRLGTPAGNTFLFWCRNLKGSPARGNAFYPVEFGPDVYAEANERAPGRAAAFPPPDFEVPGLEGQTFAGIVGDMGALEWPPQSGIRGRVMLGPPPAGDFVRPAYVGTNYRSPGYA